MTRTFSQWRLRLLAVLLVCAVSVLVYRLIQIQILEHDYYLGKAKKQWHKKVIWAARRGSIYDRMGLPLAVTHRNYSVGVTPTHFPDDPKTVQCFANVLGITAGKLQKALRRRSVYVPLGRDLCLTEEEITLVSSYAGVRLDPYHDRLHPFEAIPAPLIGGVDAEGKGTGGVENSFQDILRGQDGWLLANRDALDSTFHLVNAPGRKPVNGSDLYLTIDSRVQSIVDFELEQAVERYRAASGIAIVLCPYTGDILALSEKIGRSKGGSFGDVPDNVVQSIGCMYEPGSTFKLVTHSYLLERGAVEPYDVFYTEGGKVNFDFGTFKDDHPADKWYTFKETFVQSSNVCTIKAVKDCDPNDFYQYMLRFGFGGRTGIALPAESRGTLRKPGEWSRRSLASIAIGQEVGVTALQMAMAYCALANGGELLVPRIALAVKDEKGRIVNRFPVIKVRRVFSSETAETIREFCAEVVKSGTGKKARVDGISVAGKTGTSQKAGERGYDPGRYVASFIGFAPLQEPRVVCLVLLDEPAYPYYWGGESAAIVFSNIIEGVYLTTDILKTDAARYVALGYGADGTVTVPSFLRLTYKAVLDLAASRGLRITCSHDQGVCYSQIPDPGSPVESGGEVRLLFGDEITREGERVRVPDLRGLSVREARRLLIACGLDGKLSGFGIVKRQDPAPGSMVSRRSHVVLVCSPKSRIDARNSLVGQRGGGG